MYAWSATSGFTFPTPGPIFEIGGNLGGSTTTPCYCFLQGGPGTAYCISNTNAQPLIGITQAFGSGFTFTGGILTSKGSIPLTVTGSRGGNAALASLLTQLAALGLIVDSTTA
jgi:hypothetical protein